MAATNAVGVSIFLFRSFVYLLGHPEADIASAVILYAPGAIFYVLYGILFELLSVRDKLRKGEHIILSLWLCDSISNIIEVAVRKSRIDHPFEIVVLVLILMGLMRSIITTIAYEVINYYMHRYEREQKDRKYRELILFMASLESELFFLRKSSVDIEEAMKRSYRLYEQLQDKYLKDEALMVAKDIHEIKKDYIRVVSGIEKTLSEEDKSLYMNLKEIYQIIKANTEKLIVMNQKQIILRFKFQQNFITRDYYQLISILNNLIINAIDAIEETGIISISQETSGSYCFFKVLDNGEGIDESDIDLVFEPGFSTKYNAITGEMSTGIGLTHVKHIVERHFDGRLEVSSSEDGGTTFTIQIPFSKIAV
jgi:two-component system sensor histidine kinase YcbA